MKRCLIVTTMFAMILALPLALYAQESDPAAVVTAFYECEDVDACLSLLADDAVVDIPGWGTYSGLEEIRAWMEGLRALNFEMRFEILQVEGDTVTLKSWYTDDDYRPLGVELEARETDVVRDGKIVSTTWVVTDESMAELQAAMATLPQTGGQVPPISAAVVALGGLAVAGGFGLEVLRRLSRPV